MPDQAGQADHPERRAAWSRYWKQDVLHSLPGSFDGNYEGAIARFWRTRLEGLDARHRVLDLATGNGAIPQLACRDCGAGMPRVDAVDLAEVSPDWLASQPSLCRDALHFHSRVPAEALPFADASFDLATSQYGIEYCDAAGAVAELARVLRPGGRVALLMHHRGSRLAEVAREELRLADLLLRPGGFIDSLEGVVPWVAEAASEAGRQRLRTDPAANEAREAFNGAMQGVAAAIAASPFPDLLQEARAFSARELNALRTEPPDAVLARCRDYRASLRDARLRYAELCDCALDDAMLGAFIGRLRDSGFVDVAQATVFHDNGMLMGWTLDARKPGAAAGAPPP